MAKHKPEVFVSVDIEADGPIPGRNSMLSIGAVAFTVGKDGAMEHRGSFERNLKALEGASQDEGTMKWWHDQPIAWHAHRQATVQPEHAMRDYVAWLKELPGSPVFVGYPASYDFMFVHWYAVAFAGEDPCGFSALDLKSYAMAMMKSDFKDTTKREMPKRWFVGAPKHTHKAIDDAAGQAHLLHRMLVDNWFQRK